MHIPTNTKFTLKKIVESLDGISSSNQKEEEIKMSPEDIGKLKELTTKFDTFRQSLLDEAKILETSKFFTELCKLAKLYALKNAGDVIQSNVVKKDMAELEKKIQELNKLSEQCHGLIQTMNLSVSDMAHILGRYYRLKPVETPSLGLDGDSVNEIKKSHS